MTDPHQQPQPQQPSTPPLFEALPPDVAQLSVRAGVAYGSRVYRVDGALNWPEYRAYVAGLDEIAAARAALPDDAPLSERRELEAREMDLVYRTIAGPLQRANTDLPLTPEYLQSAVSPAWATGVLELFLAQSAPASRLTGR